MLVQHGVDAWMLKSDLEHAHACIALNQEVVSTRISSREDAAASPASSAQCTSCTATLSSAKAALLTFTEQNPPSVGASANNTPLTVTEQSSAGVGSSANNNNHDIAEANPGGVDASLR